MLNLRDRAVATSGGYQRSVTVGRRRYSHLIDPRTGRPAAGVASATVVADSPFIANPLATALAVMNPADGLKLVARLVDAAGVAAACLIVAADGGQFRSPNFAAYEVPPCEGEKKDADKPKPTAWPDGFQVTVNVELPKIDAAKYRRPYVAVWVEDGDGKPVRTLGVWGNKAKYLRDLNTWWKFGQGDDALIKAVTKATRGPGKYDLVWDGKDDKGQPVGRGTYTVRVEVHREHGKHVFQSGKIKCDAEASAATLEKNAETEATGVAYGKKK